MTPKNQQNRMQFVRTVWFYWWVSGVICGANTRVQLPQFWQMFSGFFATLLPAKWCIPACCAIKMWKLSTTVVCEREIAQIKLKIKRKKFKPKKKKSCGEVSIEKTHLSVIFGLGHRVKIPPREKRNKIARSPCDHIKAKNIRRKQTRVLMMHGKYLWQIHGEWTRFNYSTGEPISHPFDAVTLFGCQFFISDAN